MFCFLCVYFTKKQWCKFISEEALEFIFSTAKVKLHFSWINHNKQMLKYCWNPAELVIFKLWIELVDERENQKVQMKPPKISTHPFYHVNSDWFSRHWSKRFFFFEKKSKMAVLQKWPFLKSPILKIFSWKFHRFVLGLVGLHDAKGFDWLNVYDREAVQHKL